MAHDHSAASAASREWNAEALRVIDAALAFGLDDDLRARMKALINSATHEMFETAFPNPALVSILTKMDKADG